MNEQRRFENEKIRISFSIGDISKQLSVYLKDENGAKHHVLWEILPDRCNQNFDKTNEKIKTFVENKVAEWLKEEVELRRLREENEYKRKMEEENKLKGLIDSF